MGMKTKMIQSQIRCLKLWKVVPMMEQAYNSFKKTTSRLKSKLMDPPKLAITPGPKQTGKEKKDRKKQKAKAKQSKKRRSKKKKSTTSMSSSSDSSSRTSGTESKSEERIVLSFIKNKKSICRPCPLYLLFFIPYAGVTKATS